MPITKNQSNPSIIETIDKMVKDGESEEKILNTLKDIGISPDNARRLLILGQADVFSLIKGEIRKNIHQELEKEETELRKVTHDEALSAMEEVKQQMSRNVLNEIKEYEKTLATQNKSFQDQLAQKMQKIGDSPGGSIKGSDQLSARIQSMSETEEKLQQRLNQMGDSVKRMQSDMGDIGVKGGGGRNRMIGYAVILLGLIFGAGTLYIFYTGLGQPFTTYSLVVMVVMAIITVTLLVVGTLI
ncbi:MAG TPA: hypothetical protein VJG83_06355 [archaeon]|nr:hypothetical protein [archaeon]